MGRPVVKKGWVRATLYLLALIIVAAIFGIAAMLVIMAVSGNAFSETSLFARENIHYILIYQSIVLTGFTGLTFMFIKYVDRKDFTSLGLQKPRWVKDTFIGLSAGLACILSGFAILFLSGYIRIDSVIFDPAYLAGSLLLCILISWIEEISFRGYILNNLMDSFSRYVALAVSSALFAMFHIFNSGISLLPFINLFLAGILLGIVYIHTKTLWFALGLHFSWNFFQGPVFGFRVSGTEMHGLITQETSGPGFITGGDFGFEGSLISAILLVVSIIIFKRLYSGMAFASGQNKEINPGLRE